MTIPKASRSSRQVGDMEAANWGDRAATAEAGKDDGGDGGGREDQGRAGPGYLLDVSVLGEGDGDVGRGDGGIAVPQGAAGEDGHGQEGGVRPKEDTGREHDGRQRQDGAVGGAGTQ